jgi:hypothetical protein
MIVLATGAMSFFSPRENNLLLMDIQIAGEGELGDVLDSRQPEFPQIPQADENKFEENEMAEEVRPEEIPPNIQQPESSNRDENSQDMAQEDVISKESPDSAAEPEAMPPLQEPSTGDEPPEEESLRENSKEDNIANEESTPTLEKKEEKEQPVPERKKKPQKRNRKAFMDVIKRAEKKKAKAKNRKKMLEIAEKAAYRKKKNSSFDKMLSGTINDFKKGSGQGTKGRGAGSFGYGQGLTNDDREMIRSQVSPHWIVLSGVRNADTIVVDLQIQLRDNGEVVNVRVLDEKRYAGDHIFRAAADSARRAVLKASPFKIPKDKIDLFRDFTFHFDPRGDLGG